MRKRIVPSTPDAPTADVDWLDLESLVEVQITSENPDHPVEAALLPGGTGWRASGPGAQTIRLVFDRPQSLHRILLEFRESAVERTQEYVLRWSADHGRTYEDVVRQQWNFSPGGSTEQLEEHSLELTGVTVLELEINPDIGRTNAPASLERLCLA